jgi:transcriptional regulator GlxA family with amidase domain
VQILGKTDHVTSVAGLTIPTHAHIRETENSDIVVFASGIGVDDVLQDQEFLDDLHLDEERQLIGSMCGVAMILAAKGLLKGRRCTTYPTYFEKIKRFEGVSPVKESFVESGRIATAAGCMAAQLLCGWLIETAESRSLADAVIASVLPMSEGCVPFAGWGDPAAAKAVAACSGRIIPVAA